MLKNVTKEEWINNIKEAMKSNPKIKDVPKSETHRKNTSLGVIKLWKNVDYRNKVLASHRSEEGRRKHREAGLKCVNSEMLERARKLGASSKGKPSPRKNAVLSESTKKKISEVQQRPEIKLKARLSGLQIAAKVRKRGTDIERKIWKLLDSLNIDYRSNVKIGLLLPDIVVDSDKLIIECDGEYWHSGEENEERMRRRDKQFLELGYNVIHLNGSLINKNIDLCKEIILSKIKSELISNDKKSAEMSDSCNKMAA